MFWLRPGLPGPHRRGCRRSTSANASKASGASSVGHLSIGQQWTSGWLRRRATYDCSNRSCDRGRILVWIVPQPKSCTAANSIRIRSHRRRKRNAAVPDKGPSPSRPLLTPKAIGFSHFARVAQWVGSASMLVMQEHGKLRSDGFALRCYRFSK